MNLFHLSKNVQISSTNKDTLHVSNEHENLLLQIKFIQKQI